MIQGQPASDEQWLRLRADIGRLVAKRVSNAADVEDVAQEVLIRVWRHGSALRDDERFGAWLSRVVSTAAADHFSGKGRHVLLPVQPEPGATADLDADDASETTRELVAAVLMPFVAQLPPPYRETIILSELEGLSHPAIAERLSLSVSGVKSRVQRGREQLRQMLERCCQFALDVRGAPVSCDVRPAGELPPGCCGGDADDQPNPAACVPAPPRS